MNVKCSIHPETLPLAEACADNKAWQLLIVALVKIRQCLLTPMYMPDSIELFKALVLMSFNR